jgi:hypothetical protein
VFSLSSYLETLLKHPVFYDKDRGWFYYSTCTADGLRWLGNNKKEALQRTKEIQMERLLTGESNALQDRFR